MVSIFDSYISCYGHVRSTSRSSRIKVHKIIFISLRNVQLLFGFIIVFGTQKVKVPRPILQGAKEITPEIIALAHEMRENEGVMMSLQRNVTKQMVENERKRLEKSLFQSVMKRKSEYDLLRTGIIPF